MFAVEAFQTYDVTMQEFFTLRCFKHFLNIKNQVMKRLRLIQYLRHLSPEMIQIQFREES